MTTTATSPDDLLASWRPLALIAEDNVNLRENTVRMLDRRGIAAIPVGSFQQASNALTLSPRVDVALLDIHLHIDRDTDDKGGIEVARLLRSGNSSVQIIGYSGKFTEDQLTRDELELFNETRAKGTLSHEDHVELWDRCAELARASYDHRRNLAQEHLDQLRRLYEAQVPEIEVLRRFQMDRPETPEFTAEGALGLAGYKVRVVQLTDHHDRRSRPFVVWEQGAIEEDQEWINVEVYSHPDLYSTGGTETAALEALAEFIALTIADLDQHKKLNAGEERMQEFLLSLFS